MKTGLISMFLQGSGLSSADIDKVYAQPRVKLELEQEPMDAKGMYDAVYSAVRVLGFHEAVADMTGPINTLMFMNIIDKANVGKGNW